MDHAVSMQIRSLLAVLQLQIECKNTYSINWLVRADLDLFRT